MIRDDFERESNNTKAALRVQNLFQTKRKEKNFKTYSGETFKIDYPNDWYVMDSEQTSMMNKLKLDEKKAEIKNELGEDSVKFFGIDMKETVDELIDKFFALQTKQTLENIKFKPDKNWEGVELEVDVKQFDRDVSLKEYVNTCVHQLATAQEFGEPIEGKTILPTKIGNKDAFLIAFFQNKDNNSRDVYLEVCLSDNKKLYSIIYNGSEEEIKKYRETAHKMISSFEQKEV